MTWFLLILIVNFPLKIMWWCGRGLMFHLSPQQSLLLLEWLHQTRKFETFPQQEASDLDLNEEEDLIFGGRCICAVGLSCWYGGGYVCRFSLEESLAGDIKISWKSSQKSYKITEAPRDGWAQAHKHTLGPPDTFEDVSLEPDSKLLALKTFLKGPRMVQIYTRFW